MVILTSHTHTLHRLHSPGRDFGEPLRDGPFSQILWTEKKTPSQRKWWSCTLNTSMTAQATPLQTATMCGQILVNVFQTIAILGMMTVAWPEIFQTTSKSFKVFLLDLESFSLSCVAGKSSLQQFAVSTLLFPCAALWLLFLQAASQCLPDTWRKSRRKWPRSINTIGVFLEAGFGTMSAVGLQPLMCYSHPSGLYSVLKFPNVICQSGDHVAMVILGVALLCFALAFFSACVMACWKMPSWSLTDGHELVQSFRFLTSQFRMDAWWFGVLLPLRGFFLSLSVAVATDLPPAQAAAAAVVLAIYAPFQMRWWPWKVPYINQADLWMNIMLLLLVNSSVVVEGNTSVEWREFGQTYAMSIMACVAFGASFMLVRTLMELLQRHVLKIGGDEWIDPACKAISKKASQALHHCAEQLMDIEVTTLEGQLMRMNPSDLNIITSSITLISMEICPSSEQQLFHMRVALQSFNQRLTRLTMLQSAQEFLHHGSDAVAKAENFEEDRSENEDGSVGDLQKEEVQYAKFKEFCDATLTEKGKSITEAADKIELLTADMEAAGSDATRLETELAQHQAMLANATGIREKARANFLATLKDYTESINAIGSALKVLKETAAGPSLVQLNEVKKMLPLDAIKSIDEYLALSEKKPSLLMKTTAQAHRSEPEMYEFQSGGVVSLLENLDEKFVAERSTLEKEELAKKHAHEKLAASLEAAIAQSKKEIESKSQFRAKRLQTKASVAWRKKLRVMHLEDGLGNPTVDSTGANWPEAEGDLAETTTEKASDEKYAKDLKATCEKKSAAFAERKALRTEEIEVAGPRCQALGKAQEILAGGAVAGHAKTKHLPSLLGTSLAFLRSESPTQLRVAKFLQARATALNSRVLSAMAARAGADPMSKVKAMIEQLLVKMEEQANQEATKKGWCDAELKENKAIREEKADVAEGLQSEIDEVTASITKLGHWSRSRSPIWQELESAMSEATAIREKEKAKNEGTLKDAQLGMKEAQAAVAQATNDFYAKAGEATSLLQAPEVFGDEPYKGMENSGVLSMLEVIATDFARLETETKEYDEFMDDSKVDKVTKTKTSEHKTSKKQTKSQELTMLEGDLQGTQKELDAANVYYEKLKPDCIDTSESFAERKALQEAMLPRLITLDSTGTLMRVRKPVGELYLQAMQRKKPLLQASAPELSERFLTALRRRSALRPAFGTGEVGGARGWWHPDGMVEGPGRL
ncbi:unnamed protein product [Durusdinium trenchii]|uniref:Uncharacterized protein n=1 Tax=Durusdinium trenchii TaxID=1381693 RepID=A0ABP0NYD1_9DINO